ncbi:MAG: DUF3299 domain-containing protein [Caldimonas sp.]
MTLQLYKEPLSVLGGRRRDLLFGAVALVTIASAAVAASLVVLHRSPPLPPAEAPARDSFREITWDDLSPKEWDPTKNLRREDGSLISDSDPRAQAMFEDLRAIWDNAPTAEALDGALVKLPGYVVPLDESDGKLMEFLLVPYFGACIHTPPPPANQIVHVLANPAVQGFHAMDTVWVSGRMRTLRQDSPMGSSGYRLEAAVVEPYRKASEVTTSP